MIRAGSLLTVFLLGTVSMAADRVPDLVVADFARPDAPAWRAVDDVVMGGVSASRLLVDPEQGTGVFEGTVSLERGGGFASVRASVGPLDLSRHAGLRIRVRGDGQGYRLRLRTDDRLDGIAYQARFRTSGEGWEVLELPFAAFSPSFRGRTPSDAPPLDLARIRQVGLLIADRQAGAFRLEIDWIRAFAGEARTDDAGPDETGADDQDDPGRGGER